MRLRYKTIYVDNKKKSETIDLAKKEFDNLVLDESKKLESGEELDKLRLDELKKKLL
ncbi:hypothetical protein LC609_05585 [Nostoc sp. XA013]|nr:hypothetical protein [Nostoc sp. XA013]